MQEVYTYVCPRPTGVHKKITKKLNLLTTTSTILKASVSKPKMIELADL